MSRTPELSSLTIQGQAIGIPSGAAQATHLSGALPPEVAFLVRHSVSVQVLRQAVWIAESVGVTADQALIKGHLLDETAFYRALARELKLPFLPEPRLDDRVRYPEAILAGLAPLDPGAGGSPRFAIAPVGDALLRLLSGRSRLGADLAITTRSALAQAVLATRPRAVAWHAANDLPETWPEWS